MTIDIKALAKQAGSSSCEADYFMSFSPAEIDKFVRLVRESVLEDAAAQCRQLADCEENTEGYRNGAALCAERIKGMK